MPIAKRQRTAAPTIADSQSTLNFRSSKAHGRTQEKKSDTKQTEITPPKTQDLSDTLVEKLKSEARESGTDGGNDELEAPIDEQELAARQLENTARSLAETKIRAYWGTKERERKAPRVHQEDLTMREKILREFDMNSRYGPSVGIQRSARWHRAQSLGFDPPIEVLAVLLREVDAYESSTGGKRDVQRSIIDELTLSSRLRGEAVLDG